MSRIVMLDTGVLAMVTHPKSSPDIQQCNHWLERLVRNGIWGAVPEIADYELRRELLRAEKTRDFRNSTN